MATGESVQDKAFLEKFDANRRSFVANSFLTAIRAGAQTPEQVLAKVLTKLRLKPGYGEDLLAALLGDRDGALALARWGLAWEALPADERARRKAETAKDHQSEWMKAQPATEKQIAYLRSLGCDQVPASRAEASEMIEKWKR